MSRILSRSELEAILNFLPAANKHDSPDRIQTELPGLALKNGSIIPAARINFIKLKTQNAEGSQSWKWGYAGPLPYIDESIIISKKDETGIREEIKTDRILLP